MSGLIVVLIVVILLLVILAAITFLQLPEIRRYLKIRSM
ncbi:MAG: DUF6893 family small protein [Thermoleophilaceae bacterium]